jgi:hypothetical protein
MRLSVHLPGILEIAYEEFGCAWIPIRMRSKSLTRRPHLGAERKDPGWPTPAGSCSRGARLWKQTSDRTSEQPIPCVPNGGGSKSTASNQVGKRNPYRCRGDSQAPKWRGAPIKATTTISDQLTLVANKDVLMRHPGRPVRHAHSCEGGIIAWVPCLDVRCRVRKIL